MADVVNMADIKSDNRLIRPVQSIRAAADEAEERLGTEREIQSSMVILRGGDPEDYSFDYYVSNMTRSEMVALLEIVKSFVMRPLIEGD